MIKAKLKTAAEILGIDYIQSFNSTILGNYPIHLNRVAASGAWFEFAPTTISVDGKQYDYTYTYNGAVDVAKKEWLKDIQTDWSKVPVDTEVRHGGLKWEW